MKNFCKNIWWLKKKPILLSFGEVAEWSIAAVLKTVVLRGTGGSNPSLSALNNLQGVEFQPCRFFCAQKNAPKMHRPRFHVHIRVFSGLVKNFWLIRKTLPQVCGVIFLWHYHNKKQPFWTASSLSGKRDSSPRCARTVTREFIFTPPTPGRGVWGRFVRAIILHNKKSSPFGLLFCWAENETRARAARGQLLAKYIYTPNPWKGCLGSLRVSAVIQVAKRKKTALSCLSHFERKTRLELATPTLARLCSTNWAISATLTS